jgi:hypothetical protein
LGTLQIGGATGDITLGASGTGSAGQFSSISGSGLDITGNANIAGNLTLGGQLTIGDQTSDTVNVVASLSSSLIPQTTNAFDLGSASKIWRDLYISTGSIKFVEGTTVVKTLSAATLTALESSTGSANASIASLNTATSSYETKGRGIVSGSSQITYASISSIPAGIVSGSSQITYASISSIPAGIVSGSSQVVGILDSLNSYTSSNNTTNDTQNTRLSRIEESTASLNAQTSSYARKDSTNIFQGNQTITGSLFVSADLVVQGSSSIQNISSSNLVIGAAYVTLNTNSPSSRFAGINIIDSGSAGQSGSFFYDSIQDEFIQIHKGNGINVTSSHFVQGPQTYDNVGNELYLTNNRLTKGTGLEHIVDSNITDTGTLITLGSNTIITGTLSASGTTLVSGSSQITYASISSIPGGIVSGSSQVLGGTGIHSGSITNYLPTGTISGSSQVTLIANSQLTNNSISIAGTSTALGGAITLATITNGSNIVSGSSQINLASVTGNTTSNVTEGTNLYYTDVRVKTKLNAETVVSGSSQINGSSIATNTISIAGTSTALGGTIAATTIGNAIGALSGSSQVTLSSTTGYGTVINQNLLTTSDVRHNSLGVGMAASATAGRIDASGDIVAYSTSDINFKENITPIPNALEKISKISGNTYDWKADMKEFHGFEGNDVGVIAQEIEAVLPQLVTTRETGYKAVKYDKLVALLIEGIKEQQTQIHSLTIEIEKLKESKGL